MWKLSGIAVGAGITSAVLLAVITKASPAALLLASLSPLPIMIAGLGFTHPVAGAAALIGGGAVGAALGAKAGLAFLLALGLPAWHLSRLALARRAGPGVSGPPGDPAAGWCPVPTLLLNAAAAAVLPVLLGGAVLVWRFGGYPTAVDALVARLGVDWPADRLPQAFSLALAVRIAPVFGVVLATLALAFNLWLAARSVQISSLLARPWPNLPDALRLPRPAAAAFALLVGAGFLPGLWGSAAAVAAAALGILFVFEGLAAAHVLTRGLSARAAALGAIYLATALLLPWPLFALALLGCIDCLVPALRRGSGIRITKLPKRRQ